MITKDKKLADDLLAYALLDGFELVDDFTKLGINAKTYKKNDLKCGISETKGIYKFSMEKKGLLK